jgi:predicted kinase
VSGAEADGYSRSHLTKERHRAPGEALAVVLCGPSFSGKSTLARELAWRTGATVVAYDAILAAGGHPPGGAGLPEAVWAQVHELAMRQVEAELRRGATVIVDDTACYRFLRDDLRAAASRAGARAVLVHLDVPAALLRARRAGNDPAVRPPVREEVFERHLRGFEPPGADEEPVVLGEAPVAAWAQEVVAKIELVRRAP